jgi:hypothetical protein
MIGKISIRYRDNPALNGQISDATMMSAAADLTAAIAWLALEGTAVALSAPVAVGVAAAVVTAGAALTVLSTTNQAQNSTAVSDSVNTMIGQTIGLAGSMGNGLDNYFSQLSGTVDQGVSNFVDVLGSVGSFVGNSLGGLGQSVLDILIPSAQGSEMTSLANPLNNITTISITNSNGSKAGINYNANGGVEGMTAPPASE